MTLAEGVGFEPTEAFTSHAFEACPFGRSGTLPGRQVSGRSHSRHPSFRHGVLPLTDGVFLKISYEPAEEVSVHADLFADEGDFTPRPSWQVIEAARRQMLTGELLLATTPSTRLYLRDGQVYFAERTTDGGLGVRLLVEGVITRQQMGKGALLVSGVEHLGRIFQRDASIDRQSVELCVELMTDDVLISVANDVIDHYTMTMYKRHQNGIDRWLPNRVEVITHVVAASYLAEPEAVITPGDGPHVHTVGAPAPVAVAKAIVPEPAPPEIAPVAPVAEEPEPEILLPAVVLEPLVAELSEALSPDEPSSTVSSPRDIAAQEFAVLTIKAPSPPGPRYSMSSWEPITAEQLLTAPPRSSTESNGSAGMSPDMSADTALMSMTIADEVAEAVRRALAAIDAAAQSPSNA